jgi:hypothetical protein
MLADLATNPAPVGFAAPPAAIGSAWPPANPPRSALFTATLPSTYLEMDRRAALSTATRAATPTQPSAVVTKVSAMVESLRQSGALSPARAAHAAWVVQCLQLWGTVSPTGVDDGSDGDLTLYWEENGTRASLSIDRDETLAYAFRPGMSQALRFSGEVIDSGTLNEFARIVGT